MKNPPLTTDVQRILDTLFNDNKEELIQAFVALGKNWGTYFPSLDLDQIKQAFPNGHDEFKQSVFSSSDLLRLVLIGAARANNESEKIKYKEDKAAINALHEGIEIFVALIGEKRIIQAINNPNKETSEKTIQDMEEIIFLSLPSKQKAIQQALKTIEAECKACVSNLEIAIVREAEKIPGIDKQISLQQIIAAVLKPSVATQPIHEHASPELKAAVKSYVVIKSLQKTILDDGAQTPNHRLIAFKHEFSAKTTQETLQTAKSYPHSGVGHFLRKIGYCLANVFTLGAVYLFMQDSPFLSSQEKLHNRTQNVLQKADDSGIKPPRR